MMIQHHKEVVTEVQVRIEVLRDVAKAKKKTGSKLITHVCCN